MPTLGGKQFWADELFFHQWHIQRNVYTGHYRLLDERNRRYASGTFDQCRAILDDIKLKQHLPAMQGKAVIVMHGLFRTPNSMDSLCNYLANQGGYEVFNLTYPSTRDDIGEHARSLAGIIDHLDGIEEVNFVAHSMGNIVIRYYLADIQEQEAKKKDATAVANHAQHIRPKFRRFVMLAPPNHEAQLATIFANNYLFQTLAGKSGQQLGKHWCELESKLATPNLEFAIIAGGKSNGNGYNPMLPGDNDGVISVDSAKLPGARDFIVLPILHSFIMNDAKVQELTLRFLKQGYFLSESERHPLE